MGLGPRLTVGERGERQQTEVPGRGEAGKADRYREDDPQHG
ncbi:MAG: hypothetical protein ACXWE8_05890 [Solirubrobacterales bacterium]